MLFYIFEALLFDILILFVNASLTNCLQSLLAFFDQCVWHRSHLGNVFIFAG